MIIEIKNNFDNYKLKDFFNYLKINTKNQNILINNLLINNNKVDLNYILKEKDILNIDLSYFDYIDQIPTYHKLDIIYEDRDILIINKEKNMIIYDENSNDNLVNYIAYYYKKNKINSKIRYIHRLDRDTTGLFIIAKHYLIHNYLNYILENKILERKYLALCINKFKNKEGIINEPISNDRHSNKVIINKKGKEAITNYKVLKEHKNYSLVELKLETGRKHQIRIHMKSINHPLLGDNLYNKESNLIDRCALHSYSVKFYNPLEDKEINIKIDLPEDMKEIS